jgi:hypothetical protein
LNTLSLLSALNVRGQVLHPHTTSTSIVLYTFIPDSGPNGSQHSLLQLILIFFINGISIYQGCSHISELCHTFKGFITPLYDLAFSCILFIRHDHILCFH